MNIRPSKTYEESLAEVATLVDRLGLHIDKNIRATVAALRMHSVSTTGSCEGHLDRGLPFPWIDLGIEEKIEKAPPAPNPKIEQLSHELQKAAAAAGEVELYTTVVAGPENERYFISVKNEKSRWRELKDTVNEDKVKQTNLKQLAIVTALLDEFYRDRNVAYAAMLTIERHGIYGEVRLQSIGGTATRLKAKQSSEDLNGFQAEMAAFADFLKTNAT